MKAIDQIEKQVESQARREIRKEVSNTLSALKDSVSKITRGDQHSSIYGIKIDKENTFNDMLKKLEGVLIEIGMESRKSQIMKECIDRILAERNKDK